MKQPLLRLPACLQDAIDLGYVVGVIQFGSSLRKEAFRDIDLAVILRRNSYARFLRKVYGKKFLGLDISLIREEELRRPKQFRFGSHGLHFAKALQQGKLLYGTNPFSELRISEKEIKRSIILRLYDYMYDVRRAVFAGRIQASIIKRWPKFVRLALYLLNPSLEYPAVLHLKDDTVVRLLMREELRLPARNLLLAHEMLWEKVLQKYDLI